MDAPLAASKVLTVKMGESLRGYTRNHSPMVLEEHRLTYLAQFAEAASGPAAWEQDAGPDPSGPDYPVGWHRGYLTITCISGHGNGTHLLFRGPKVRRTQRAR